MLGIYRALIRFVEMGNRDNLSLAVRFGTTIHRHPAVIIEGVNNTTGITSCVPDPETTIASVAPDFTAGQRSVLPSFADRAFDEIKGIDSSYP